MVVPNVDGTITYREGDGTEHVFTPDGAAFVPPPGKHIDLTANSGGYRLRFKDGTTYDFDAQGLLVTISDTNGNQVTIQRDAAGLPVAVIDATGRRVLTFTSTAGKITKVTDLTGRAAVYEYQGDDLIAVTDTGGKRWAMSYDLPTT